jgi:hypothetical protein
MNLKTTNLAFRISLAMCGAMIIACGGDSDSPRPGNDTGPLDDVDAAGDTGVPTDAADTSADTSGDAGGDSTTNDTGADTALPDPGEAVATPRGSLALELSAACTIDFECEAGLHCFVGRCAQRCDIDSACEDGATCSERGRCVSSRKSLDDAPDRNDVSISLAPGRDYRIARGADRVVLEARLEGTEIPDELEYRVEDSEGLTDSSVVNVAPVVDGEVDFVLPVSSDDVVGLETPELVVRVTTEAGSFSVIVMPEVPVAGSYAGEVSVAQFGSVGMPLELEIVTEPSGASLEEATTAWVLLPSSRSNLFSPTPAGEEVIWDARVLAYDELTETWFASFRHDYALIEGSFVGTALGDDLQRTISVELAVDSPGTLVGRLDDRWTGLYDSRTAGGVVSPAVLIFSGAFDLRRVRDARAPEVVVAGVDDAVSTGLRPLPTLEACTDEMLGVADDSEFGVPTAIDLDGRSYSCGETTGGFLTSAITSVAQFASPVVSDSRRSSCAIAVAETALAGETTAKLVESFFDGDGITPGSRSFSDFMQDCAAGVDGLCRPTPEILCARQLLSFAYSAPTVELSNAADVVGTYERVSREAFLGRQLGAFQTDSETRLTWLRSTDFPAIVTAVLRDFTADLLSNWRQNVLDIHLQVLAGQFDASGMALLSRQVSGAQATTSRQQLLFEMSQSWRGAMDALVLAAQRWNTLLLDGTDRSEASAEVSVRALDLYLVAGVASNLNLRAGAGFANATFGGGFGALARESRKLALSFDQLAYARDAEVVVSRSLDPMSDNFNLLSNLEDAAFEGISEAAGSVGDIITESTERELSTTQIRNRLDNEISALRNELVELCGVPAGCVLSDIGTDPDCDVQVAAGECGFDTTLDRLTGERVATAVNVSDAAGAYNSIQEANNGVLIAQSELVAVLGRAEILENQADAFAAKIGEWNTARLEAAELVQAVIDERSDDWSQAMQDIGADIAEQSTLRTQLATDAANDASSWNQLRVGGINTNFTTLRTAFELRRTARAVELVGTAINRFAEASVAALPTVIGATTDPSSIARGGLMLKAAKLRTAGDAIAEPLLIGAESIRISADQTAQLRSAELSRLRDQDLADDLILQNQIDDLRAQAQLDMTEQQIIEFQVDRVIAAMRAITEAELAYERDQVELSDRQDEILGTLVGLSTLNLRIGQAELGVIQKQQEYLQIVLRAELLASRLAELENQRQNLSLLLGSPAVVFAWANRLSQAESELDRARVGLMNWLVAMEYYAVRPFMDQRIQILLARNTYQLEDIAADMRRLQSQCGGALNEESTTISLARLINVSEPAFNPDTDEVATPFDLFQTTLRRGDVSVDRRIRLGTSVSGLDIQARDDLLSATFEINIESFANLGLTCNAKVLSFDIALTGEDLGTDLLPTVSIVYDGTSRVRSCQPGITEYVASFGAGATSFGEITTFRSPSRGISVVAGLGAFPSDTLSGGANRTLSGLPLSSSYTIIIDPTIADNRFIDWENLSDIQIRVNYGYQDVFPVGACQ